MKPLRRAARADKNEKEIVKALRTIPGVTVAVGHDDILVGYKGKTYWFEIKNPQRTKKKDGSLVEGSLKQSQQDLLDTWKGHYQVVHTLKEILEAIGITGY
jgi:hypothetical protein